MASAACFALRLHASAAPPRVGLTQALGGIKTFVFRRRFAGLFNRPTHCYVIALLNCRAQCFRQSCIASERLRGALTLRMRYACRLRKQRTSSVSFPTPDPLLRRRPADSSRGALKHPGSGFRQARQGPIYIGIHRHLTIRSSRPRVVASAACFALRLHASAAPPRVGLTQALCAV